MPLPSDSTTTWPPTGTGREYAKFAEWAAWYSGDPQRLRDVYAGFSAQGQVGNPWYRFWSRVAQSPADQKAQMHVPVAGDLVAVGAALLFGEEPRIWIAEAHGDTEDPGAVTLEERLEKVLLFGGAFNRLVEAAESCSAMGGVYLHPVWDQDLAPVPMIGVTQVDQAVPEFKLGVLSAVTFWRELEAYSEGNRIVRHLERHERVSGGNSHVVNAVYRGSGQPMVSSTGVVGQGMVTGQLGERLRDGVMTMMTGLEPEYVFPFKELDVEYVPNRRPNRLWRASAHGLSDYSGSETVLDAIDETYASWVRDIRLAKARLIVPREFLDEEGNFDVDHEAFTPVTMEPGAAEQGARSMLAQQFEIRHEEHLGTILELVERVVSNAGYSPQTFGMKIDGRAESGTALRIRENKTTLTRARKSQWWTPAINRLVWRLLLIDSKPPFSGGSSPEGKTITTDLSSSATRDPVELANVANTLKAAMAASIETRVRLIHPEWRKDQVAAEVERIKDEEGGEVPDPTLFAGAGNGPLGDEAPSPPKAEGDEPPPKE
jgi:hypothetical protein